MADASLVPELIEALREAGGEEIIVVVGGVIPQQDYAMLKAAGVAAIYGPGTNMPEATREVLGFGADSKEAGVRGHFAKF